MKWEKENTRELAITSDLLNTLGGGIAETRLDLFEGENEYTLVFSMPGLKEDNLDLEIYNSVLFINLMIEISEDHEGHSQHLPYELATFQIPESVKLDEVSASFEDDALEVDLPFNERSEDYHRRVRIRKTDP